MARALTQAQLFRRSTIVMFLVEGVKVADEVREHLARVWSVFVTVDTVQRDLRALERIHVVACRGRSAAGNRWELRRAVG